MPTLRDNLSGGEFEVRRRFTRPMHRWDLVFPGLADRMDPLLGFLELAQGDTKIMWDGAGMLEMVEPFIIGIGNGSIVDFDLPHRNVYVSSAVIYLNGAATNTWTPLGGDGVTMQKIHFGSPPGNFSQIKAKYRRAAKVIVDTDGSVAKERIFRTPDNVFSNPQRIRLVLQEVP